MAKVYGMIVMMGLMVFMGLASYLPVISMMSDRHLMIHGLVMMGTGVVILVSVRHCVNELSIMISGKEEDQCVTEQ